jgi:putative flippase GtrA
MTALTASRPLASHRDTLRQLVSFGAIGVASTVAYVALYSWLRETMPAGGANALALVITAVGNTSANRLLTFRVRVRGRDGLARDHAAGLLALGAALAITSVSLVVLTAVAPHHGRLTEVAILVLANALATLVRFVLLRLAIDRPRDARQSAASERSINRASPARMPAQPTLATLSQSERTRG